MKAIFFLAVVAACAAVTCGNPVNRSPISFGWFSAVTHAKSQGKVIKIAPNKTPIDWARTEVLVEEFRNLFNTTTSTVATIAVKSNPVVGSEIADIANKAGKEIDASLRKMLNDVKKQTLTDDQVIDYVGEVGIHFIFSTWDIEPLLEHLSETDADIIRKTYGEANKSAEIIVDELFEIFGIDWWRN